MVRTRSELAGLLDEKRAADILRLSVRTLQQARQDDVLQASALLPEAQRVAGRIYYSTQDVEAALSARLSCPRLRKRYTSKERAIA